MSFKMFLRRRLKNPKYLLAGLICLFFIVFFLQYFNYDEIDMSYQLKKNQREAVKAQTRPSLDDNSKYANAQEESTHLVKKAIDSMKRIVHLDLKGSQPKLTYLADLITFFKRAGATGVLIEYEDFFPYENDLEAIRNQNHYTKQEIYQIFKLIKENDLTLIPLVQTYGHLEFVLKLKQFEYLREDKKHFQAITPCLPDAYEKVIFRMIDQILDIHPEEMEYIHIGCDEVYLMNRNPACHKIDESGSFTSQDWFILHVSKIVEYIKSKRPYLSVIIWDDMIRKSLSPDPRPSRKLIKFAKSVVPMVWDYNERVEVSPSVLRTYETMFSEIWIASAFKGATNHLELMPNITKHYRNQQSWLSTVASFKKPLRLKGIAFTGWSRYDHMQSVCEIMSSAVPSLALCMQAFINYDKDESIVFTKAKDLTECNYNRSRTGFVLDPFSIEQDKNLRNKPLEYTCSFPGSNIYKWLLNLKLVTQKLEYKHAEFGQILNDYNLKNKFFNTLVHERALLFYAESREKLKAAEASGEQLFDKFYYSDLYEEIKEVYIARYVDLIDRRVEQLKAVKLPESAPNRPFNKISLTMV